MNKYHVAGLAAAIAAAFGAGVLAQPPAAPPAPRPPAPQATGAIAPIPANLTPSKIDGTGLNVADINAERAWYQTVLGMHQVGQYPATGTPSEYIMSMSSKAGEQAVLCLLRGARQPGATTYGRTILAVPDSRALADFLMAHGVTARNVAPGAYFIQDPEGNNIELFTPPAA